MARTPPQGLVGGKKVPGKEKLDPLRGRQGSSSEDGGPQGRGKRSPLTWDRSGPDKTAGDRGTQSQDEERETRPRRLESPPERTRALSLSDCSVVITRQEEKEKRKRTEDSPGDGNNPKKGTRKKQRGTVGEPWDSQYTEAQTVREEKAISKEYNKLREFVELLSGMMEEIKELRTVVMENQNTKVEIKKSSGILEDMVAQIDAEEYVISLTDLIEKGAAASSSILHKQQSAATVEEELKSLKETNDRLRVENTELRRENEALKKGNQRLNERVKTMEATPRESARNMEQNMFGGDTYEQYAVVEGLTWPKSIYRTVIFTVESPYAASRDTNLLVLQGGGENNAGALRILDRYPDIEKTEGKIGAISIATRTIGGVGGD